MNTLRGALVKLAHEKPELREHLLPLLSSKQAGLSFKKKTITLKAKGKSYKVEAEVVGSWAVHLDTPPPKEPAQPGWVVTFIPTSQKLVWERSKTDAKKNLGKVLKALPEIQDAKSVGDLTPHWDTIKKALR